MLERLKEERSKYIVKATKILLDEFALLFKENPNLDSFYWEQYTPYFNDGEACYFSFHEIDIDNIAMYEYDFGQHYNQDIPPNIVKDMDEMVNKINNLLESAGEEILLDVFGDHATITVTKDGFEIEENTDHY